MNPRYLAIIAVLFAIEAALILAERAAGVFALAFGDVDAYREIRGRSSFHGGTR